MKPDRKSTAFYQQLLEIVDESQITLDEPLDKHTTFRVGGPANYFIEVKNAEEIAKLVYYFSLIDFDYYVLGNGSNVLAGDKGYSGAIVSLHKHMTDVRVEGNRIICQGGAMLSAAAAAAAEAGLTGLEFASGIPGTVGGALVMNAGAYGGEISQVLEKAEVVALNGAIINMYAEEMMFGYRTSIFKKEPLVCTQAIFSLQPGDKAEIKAKMDDLKAQRRAKQPLEYPSAGSTFKRPEGYFAGKLIMDANLRGMQIGGARVSEKHCGFIVNVGGASAADIKDLMDEVTERVKECHGVRLEPEVCMLGDF